MSERLNITDEDRKRGYTIVKCVMPKWCCLIGNVWHESPEREEREIAIHLRKKEDERPTKNPSGN